MRLVRQRVFQIAAGYEDQNDSDTLRSDPLLKMVCGRLPESEVDLASQPTISRLENAPDARSCLRMARALGELYIAERGKGGLPERDLLDFDATDDPAHGDQEGAYYHGFYQEHILHPLLVFDGDTGQLISALLRAGNTHASRGALSILKRIVGRLREAWEGVKIEIRADAGFAIPEVCDYCEKEGIGYTIGLTPTRGSKRSPIISSAEPNGSPRSTKQRRRGSPLECLLPGGWLGVCSEGHLQSGAAPKGHQHPLCGYQPLRWARGALRLVHIRRGEAEGWPKDFKRALKADRLSCHRFFANQFRLLLHAAAYGLLDTLRRKLVESGVRRMQLDTLRLILVKIGGRV